MAAPAVAAPTQMEEDATYLALCTRLREINALSSISGLLGWDEQVMMPKEAAELRATQGSTLAGAVFEKETAAELGEILAKLVEKPPTEQWKAANVREAARNYKRKTALSKDLAQREARLSSDGYQAWARARASNNFPSFAPVLESWLELTREKCAAINGAAPPYDVALESFEKGLTSARLDEVFAELRAGLVPLLADVRARGTPPDDSWLGGDFDVGAQTALCRSLALEMGFDLARGRLDVSLHPFTGGAGPSDVRMTTRYKAHDLIEGLTGTIHETGHALYEQGRPGGDADGLPVSEALSSALQGFCWVFFLLSCPCSLRFVTHATAPASVGAHESQSLLWERCVGLSRPFAAFLLPRLRAAFPQLPPDKTADDLYAALNKVSSSPLIRIESDELSYALHSA